jgi:hypothetical protein
MEVVDIVSLLKSRGIDEKTIFYGIETIVSDKPFWKICSIIKKVSPPFVQFYKLPREDARGCHAGRDVITGQQASALLSFTQHTRIQKGTRKVRDSEGMNKKNSRF